jgi:hypothetical protein
MAPTTSDTNTPAITTRATVVDPSTTRTLVWRFEASGWTSSQAANLVALAHGLRPASRGWTVREIEHLRFLRSLVCDGRIDS